MTDSRHEARSGESEQLPIHAIVEELRMAASYLRVACPEQVSVMRKIDEMADQLEGQDNDV